MCNKKNNMKNIGIIFLLFSFYTAFNIREQSGLNFFLFIIIVCIFTDIGGYIFGKTFKGPKLTKISPNKTYAGVIGSFLFSLIAGLIFIKYIGDIGVKNTNQLSILFGILLISFISQIGDLIISYFKRKAKMKDTGKILPGHGGLLDRIDGLIFVVPTVYLLQFIK
jgi:phosphatidate cytidylyltransferase